MLNLQLLFALSLPISAAVLPNHSAPPEQGRIYRVSIPDDDRVQEVLDLSIVSTPGPWRVEQEAEYGNRFLYVEAQNPSADAVEVVVEFTLRRDPVMVDVDPAKVGPITDIHRRVFANEIRRDAPHMEVTDKITAIANEVCGSETNAAVQTHKLLEYVAAQADHYSKDPTKPNCGVGDANVCLDKGGGCCTDLHSLFIALARARGIPARLQMGYRVLEKNEGKEVDPGYRCWVEYFLPGYGWVPSDIVEADAPDGLGPARWFTGLTERRLWLNEGREFVLSPRQAGSRVNTMIQGYAEIDGRPARVLPEGELKPQLTRRVHFVEVRGDEPAALRVGAAGPAADPKGTGAHGVR
jgi:transglutaminase-like putative cysteine protease